LASAVFPLKTMLRLPLFSVAAWNGRRDWPQGVARHVRGNRGGPTRLQQNAVIALEFGGIVAEAVTRCPT
jgi:hypothetical protein